MKTQSNRLDASTIKNAINPQDFYLREQNLFQLGNRSRQWASAGLCPFHPDTKQGSFKINLVTGAFHCWSCGSSGGDIIAFIQNRDGLEFIDTLRLLCNQWGLSC